MAHILNNMSGHKVEFESSLACCLDCLDEGDNFTDACCCTHEQEWKAMDFVERLVFETLSYNNQKESPNEEAS